MNLPWWLADYEWTQIENVLRRLAAPQRHQFELIDADIVSRLLRNQYIVGEIEATVIGHNGPISIEIVGYGLTEMGRTLLLELEENAPH